MRKNLQLNPLGDGLAFLAMISWGCYSALIKQKASWKPEILMKPEVLANFLFLVLHEKMTMASVAGAALIFIGLVISQKKTVSF